MQAARPHSSSASHPAPSFSSFSRPSTSSGPTSLSRPSTSSGPSFSRPSSAESFSRANTLTTPIPEVIVVAENLHEGRHGDKYRAILEREEDYKCKETFTRGKRSPGRSRKADRSDQSDSVYKYKLKNELRKRRLPCIVHFCLIY